MFEGGWRALLAVATLHRVCWVRAITYTAHPDPLWTAMGPDLRSLMKVGRNQKYWPWGANVVFEGGWRALLAVATLHRV